MKKIVVSLVLCLVLIMPVIASAAGDVSINLDGAVLETSVAPKIVSGRTMLPMEDIFEALGAKAVWIADGQTIFATKGEYVVVMQIDNTLLSVCKSSTTESEALTLDVVPFMENNRALVPVRAVAEALDAQVDWIKETRTVVIKTQK